MNTKAVGDYGLSVVITDCMKKGYAISLPFGDNARYDAIVERAPGRLERIQVKTVTPVQGKLIVPTKTMQYVAGTDGNNRSCMRCYTADEIDVIVCVDFTTGKTYWLHSDMWDGKTGVTLRVEALKQQANMKYAADYEKW